MPILTTRGALAPFLAIADSDAAAFTRSGLLADYWIGIRAPAGRASAIGPTPAADAPPVANDDNFTTDEVTVVTGNLFADNGHGMDNDPDGPPLMVATVNGSAVNVGVQVTVGSGALLTVNADGSFTYNPNHAFDATAAAGSGAANSPGHETFSYTLVGGGSALMFVSINGIDNDDTLLGTAGADTLISGVGNDRLFGLGGADNMTGGTGDDTYFVDNAGDVVNETAGQGYDVIAASATYVLATGVSVELLTTGDINGTAVIGITGNDLSNEIWGNAAKNSLNGGDGNDSLVGFAGDDRLDGGAGADLMIGGAGNDTFFVDNVGDVIVDDSGVVAASISYTLAPGLHITTFTTGDIHSTNAINLTGNDTGQTIQGNAANNILTGGGIGDVIIGNGGNDVLNGGAGNDLLVATDGNDVLNGGAGVDQMFGGDGNDTYFVDDASDSWNEDPNSGFDIVASAVSRSIHGSIELVTTGDINGTAAINFTGGTGGNSATDQFWGNAGVNTLDGGGGNDSLLGYGGNDVLIGGAGFDLLIGGAGNDSLNGGSEADTFAFTEALSATTNVDNVVDFVAGTDHLVLEDAVFTGLALGTLAPGAFVISTQARDADDHIIYNPTTGELFFDADGDGAGAQILFATLQGAPTISAADFIVV